MPDTDKTDALTGALTHEQREAETAMQGLMDVVRNAHALKARLRYLQEVEAWAIANLTVQPGQRAVIADGFAMTDRHSGWWAYREALVPGATGTVMSAYLHRSSGHWHLAFQPDVLWARSSYQPEMVYPRDTTTFYLRATDLRPIQDTDVPLVMPTSRPEIVQPEVIRPW